MLHRLKTLKDTLSKVNIGERLSDLQVRLGFKMSKKRMRERREYAQKEMDKLLAQGYGEQSAEVSSFRHAAKYGYFPGKSDYMSYRRSRCNDTGNGTFPCECHDDYYEERD